MNCFYLNADETTILELIKSKDFDGIANRIIAKMPQFIAAVVIIVAGIVVSKLVGKLVVKAMSAKGVDPSVHSFIKTIVMFIVNLIFVLSALSTLNIDVNSFVTALGAAGVTAGIGLQASISQFASGIQILFNHPFKSGDFVDIGSVSGKVQEIKMMYTVLITPDNKRVIIPNSTITSSNIINYNAENKRRLDLVYSISYNDDITRAKEVILDVVKKNDLILPDPAPVIAVKEHAASSINLACLVWCSGDNYWDAFYSMQEMVKLAFDENGISIPYGQVDVHIVKE